MKIAVSTPTHGPYLPAFTDGILSDRLTKELAQGVAARKPGWTALVFPPISVGASGSNEIGKQFVFPGTYAVRPSTLRAIFMDVATELDEQGFRWIMVVHVHGSPLHIGVIDDASDFFHDTYGGRMVNLWGLLPVLGGWGKALERLTDAQKKEDGVSLHGGIDEHSLMLHPQSELVAADYRDAKSVAGATYDESFAAAKQSGWPGYLGAPRLANPELGRHIWTSFSAAALATTLEILDGADPSKYPRYLSYLVKMPLYQDWIASANDRDAVMGEKQQTWLAKRRGRGRGSRYSVRSMATGSALAARLAGRYEASSTIPSNAPPPIRKVLGSAGLTSKSRTRRERVTRNAPIQ